MKKKISGPQRPEAMERTERIRPRMKPKAPNRKTYVGRDLMQILRETTAGETPSDMVLGGEPNVYTERREGVRPEFNIRTDKYDLALEAIQWAREKRDAEKTTETESPKEIGQETIGK